MGLDSQFLFVGLEVYLFLLFKRQANIIKFYMRKDSTIINRHGVMEYHITSLDITTRKT